MKSELYLWQTQAENGEWSPIAGESLGFSAGQQVVPVLMTDNRNTAEGRFKTAALAYGNSTGRPVRLVGLIIVEDLFGGGS